MQLAPFTTLLLCGPSSPAPEISLGRMYRPWLPSEEKDTIWNLKHAKDSTTAEGTRKRCVFES